MSNPYDIRGKAYLFNILVKQKHAKLISILIHAFHIEWKSKTKDKFMANACQSIYSLEPDIRDIKSLMVALDPIGFVGYLRGISK